MVLLGKAGIYKDDEFTKCEKELQPGQFFGEKALKEPEFYQVNVVAHKVCVCLILEKPDFEE